MRKVYYDDFVCWLEILRDGGHARGLYEDLLRYRVLAGSVSRNKFKSAREVWKIYRSVLGLSAFEASFYFSSYLTNAIIKYRKF
jgi:teichuronic acid biosynthesis glycosyltransferase TuaG